MAKKSWDAKTKYVNPELEKNKRKLEELLKIPSALNRWGPGPVRIGHLQIGDCHEKTKFDRYKRMEKLEEIHN